MTSKENVIQKFKAVFGKHWEPTMSLWTVRKLMSHFKKLEKDRMMKKTSKSKTITLSSLNAAINELGNSHYNFKAEITERILILEQSISNQEDEKIATLASDLVSSTQEGLQEQNATLLGELSEAQDTINRVERQRQELEQLTYSLKDQIHSLEDQIQNLSAVLKFVLDDPKSIAMAGDRSYYEI